MDVATTLIYYHLQSHEFTLLKVRQRFEAYISVLVNRDFFFSDMVNLYPVIYRSLVNQKRIRFLSDRKGVEHKKPLSSGFGSYKDHLFLLVIWKWSESCRIKMSNLLNLDLTLFPRMWILTQLFWNRSNLDGESWPYDFLPEVNRGDDVRKVCSSLPMTTSPD